MCVKYFVFQSILTHLTFRSPEEGFNSVRKWTSKFDLFQKKYIIVPINEKYVILIRVGVTGF
jgi:Ulp1 family protease